VTNLDRESLDRILPDTPGSADWNDVMSRFHASRSGPRRRRLVMLAAAALVAIVGTASAIAGVRDLFPDRGFIGLPPVGATPSAPERGELVVHWSGFSATLPPARGGTIVGAWLYADGRIIWTRRARVPGQNRGTPEGANEFNSGYLERRLSPESVELVRTAVAELFDHSRTLLETFPADDDRSLGLGGPPWGWWGPAGRLTLFVPRGFSGSGSVEVPEGDRFVRLRWAGIDTKNHGDTEGPIATPEQLSALRQVDALLTEPASVLPPSAWAVREVRAYVPSHYAVCIYSAPPKDASHLLSMLPARGADLLRDESRTGSEDDVVSSIDQEPGHMVVVGRSVTYCYKVETAEAREVADALSGLDRLPGWTGFALAYRVAEGVDNFAPTRIWFEPYFPHGGFTFSGPAG
jgi:hypothetical protein